jgi:hypothetical protein
MCIFVTDNSISCYFITGRWEKSQHLKHCDSKYTKGNGLCLTFYICDAGETMSWCTQLCVLCLKGCWKCATVYDDKTACVFQRTLIWLVVIYTYFLLQNIVNGLPTEQGDAVPLLLSSSQNRGNIVMRSSCSRLVVECC